MKSKMTLCILFVLGTLGISSALHAQKVIDQKEASFQGVKILNVEGRFCNVIVEAENQKKVDFSGEIIVDSRRGGDLEIHYEKEGDILRVWVDDPSGFYRHLEGRLVFKVPVALHLDIKNSSGNISVNGIQNADLKLKASSGDIELERINSNVELETTSGDVEIVDLIGDIEGKSSSGDQSFRKVEGNIYTRATSGELSFFDVNGDIESKTSSGDVDYSRVKGNIRNESTSGDIEVHYSIGALSLKATSGSIRGEGVELKRNSRFRTTSGDISMDLENDLEELSFDLHASSGDLYVGNRHGDKDLVFRRGDILIRGESSSGSQRYR